MRNGFDSLVSREGRLGQQGYVLAFVLPFVALAAASWLAWTNAASVPSAAMPVLVVGWLVLFGVGDALNIRRYHDLGNSGRLYQLLRPGVVLLPAIAFGLEYILPAQAAMVGDTEALMKVIGRELGGAPVSIAPPILLGLTAVGVIGNLLYLSLMPGQAGPNAYGPDPRGGVAALGSGGTNGAAANGEDPVERALREYRQRGSEGMGGAAPRASAVRPPAPTPSSGRPASGATFGKKR
jgi:uncharacterized membrane protein YhaH (DUF805 family)